VATSQGTPDLTNAQVLQEDPTPGLPSPSPNLLDNTLFGDGTGGNDRLVEWTTDLLDPTTGHQFNGLIGQELATALGLTNVNFDIGVVVDDKHGGASDPVPPVYLNIDNWGGAGIHPFLILDAVDPVFRIRYWDNNDNAFRTNDNNNFNFSETNYILIERNLDIICFTEIKIVIIICSKSIIIIIPIAYSKHRVNSIQN
jgi:hypothetical protein